MTLRFFRTLASTLVLSLIAPLALQAQARTSLSPNRLTQPVSNNSRVTLRGTVHPLANALNDRGAAPASMPLDHIQIVLKRSASQEADLRQLIEEQNTPGSANYHKWLTPEQFGQKFGPSDEDVATLESWLQSQGFNIEKLTPGRQSLVVSGSAAQFQNAFHAQIRKYAVKGRVHYANATNPEIPEALAPVFGGFASLNNFPIQPKAQIRGKALYNPKTGASQPQWTVGSESEGVNFVVSPADFAKQYNLTPLYDAGMLGQGQTIAIINEANINVGLVNAFRSTFNLPPNPPQVVIAGNDPGIDGVNNPDGPNGASIEAYVDVEWAGAVAPAAKIDLVIAADTALQSGLILAAEHAIYNNLAPVMSVSFGLCEAALGSENAFLSNLWEQAAAQGITVLVASGDSGSAGCDAASAEFATQGAAVSGFASTPYNVAVGGTDFYYSSWNQGSSAISAQIEGYWDATPSNAAAKISIKRYVPEQPWNDSQYGLNLIDYYSVVGQTTIGGAGGGPSTCATGTASSSGVFTSCAGGYAKPSWQTGAGVPDDKVRDIPDVSLFAADGVNASFYPSCVDDADCQPVDSSGEIQISGGGGTSFSAPAFAGIMALVNQKYGPQGQANYVLYPLAAQYPAAFHDVTNGNNSVPCALAGNFGQTPDCISVSGGVSVDGTTEGQIGSGTKAEYSASTGYDLASGLGSVDAAELVNHWGDVKFASSGVTLTPSQTTFTHGTAISVSGTVTGDSPTGTVALMTDSAEQGQQAQGVAQWLNGDQGVFKVSGGAFSGSNINSLPGGTYNIWGRYSGDGQNAASTSEKTQITVTPEASGIYLAVFQPIGTSFQPLISGTTVPYGTQLEFSAVVTPSSKLSATENCLIPGSTSPCPIYGRPTGTVVFSDSGTAFNTATLDSEGDAEYNPTDMMVARSVTNVGMHSITATYSGDNSYNASTAAATTFQVVKATPEILQVVNPDNPRAGQATTITVAVQSAGVGAAPSGTVTVSGAPSGTPGSVTLQGGASAPGSFASSSESVGVGLITIPASAAAGTYNITLTYGGDANYASNSETIPVVIAGKSSLKPSTTTINISPGATSATERVSIAVTVAGDGTTVPTGTVDIQSSGYELGAFQIARISGSANAGVTVTGNSEAFLQGANLITAIYSGDKNYAGSSATGSVANPLADFTLTPATSLVPVTPGTTSTDVVQVASVNGFHSPVTLTCTAASGITCTPSPSSVVLAGGGSAAVTVSLSADSSATNGMNDVLLTARDGTGTIIHTLGLRADVQGATEATAGFTVSANPGTLSVAPGATTGNTEAVSVLPLNSFKGAVTLTAAITSGPSDPTSPPTLAFNPASLNINGDSAIGSALTVTTSSDTTLGNYAVTVTGTSGSETETAQFTINVSNAGFKLSADPTGLTLSAGATLGNTSTITVEPSGGFTGNVSFSCAVTSKPTGANDSPTCSADSVSVNGLDSVSTTMMVTTTAPATSAEHGPLNEFFTAGGGVALAGLLFFGIPARRRKWRNILMVLLFVGIAGFGIGCGSSGGSGSGGTIAGTTAGDYVLTVTGTSGSITANTTVNLTVK